jgi:hypothetical protein
MVKASVRTAKAPGAAQPTAAPVVSSPLAGASVATSEALVDAEVVDTPSSPTGPEEPTPGVPARREQYSSRTVLVGDGIDGDWSDKDVKLPQFKIVQGSGPLSQVFQNGEIIFNEETLLPPPSIKPDAKNPAIRIVPVSLKRQWVEKLTQERQDAGEQGKIVYSLQEVLDNGGTTQWQNGERPDNFWDDGARIILLIEKPETSEHAGFNLEFGGKLYALAVWYVSGGAYRSSAKVIIGAAQSSLLVSVLDDKGQPQKSPTGQIIKRPMVWKNFWSLNFIRKPVGPKAYMVWYPSVRLQKEETSPDIRAYVSGIAGNAATQEAAE